MHLHGGHLSLLSTAPGEPGSSATVPQTPGGLSSSFRCTELSWERAPQQGDSLLSQHHLRVAAQCFCADLGQARRGCGAGVRGGQGQDTVTSGDTLAISASSCDSQLPSASASNHIWMAAASLSRDTPRSAKSCPLDAVAFSARPQCCLPVVCGG